MNELFGSQNYIDVELFYKIEKTKNGQFFPVPISEDDFNKAKADEKAKDKVKSLRTKWLMPTWKAANDLLQAATIYNFHKEEQDVDWNVFRDKRLKTYLIEWDAKENDGSAIPCNEENINMLHQNIALALLKKYDESTRVSQDEEQKN